MNWKKLLAALIAALIAISGMALAEDDRDARIAELEQQVAELTAQVEQYHRKELVAEFDGGEVLAEDARAEYDYYASMYAQYGISLADYGMEDAIKEQVATGMAEEMIALLMADKLGIAVTDDARAAFETESAAAYESTVQLYYEQYFKESYPEEADGLAAAADYLNELGYGYDSLLESHIKSYLRDELYARVTEGVAVTDEDIQAAYDALVEKDRAAYEGSPSGYERAHSSATPIAWNPEGYRAVKHILFKFDDAQAARYAELVAAKSALESEKTAEPAEGAEKRADADIDADIAKAQSDIDALYEELMPEVDAAIARFNDGEDIDALITELNDDPGMGEQGYAVCEKSELWDPAFSAGAMSIPAIGGISEPVRGIYGVHVIYYMADIPAGPVPLDGMREDLQATTLETKLNETYAAKMDEWKEELNLKIYIENY